MASGELDGRQVLARDVEDEIALVAFDGGCGVAMIREPSMCGKVVNTTNHIRNDLVRARFALPNVGAERWRHLAMSRH
jgi:hypothetical protein